VTRNSCPLFFPTQLALPALEQAAQHQEQQQQSEEEQQELYAGVASGMPVVPTHAASVRSPHQSPSTAVTKQVGFAGEGRVMCVCVCVCVFDNPVVPTHAASVIPLTGVPQQP